MVQIYGHATVVGMYRSRGKLHRVELAMSIYQYLNLAEKLTIATCKQTGLPASMRNTV